MHQIMKAPLLIIASLLSLLVSWNAQSQSKVSLADPESLVTASVDDMLTAKFKVLSLEYTSLVDVNKPCEYYYASIEFAPKGYLLSVWNCKREMLGEKTLTAGFFQLPESDVASMLFYSVTDIINNPSTAEPRPAEPVNNNIAPAQEPQQSVVTEAYATNIDEITVNQHNSRYFFSPTSYNLKKGELYYNTILFALHDLQYGITDNFSFGMGTSIGAFPFYITPKYSFRINEKHSFALGDLMMIGTYGIDFMANLLYGTYTYGNQFNNLTIGLGYMSSDENEIFGKKVSEPVLNISGMAHLSPYMYFVTENYLLSVNTNMEAGQYRDTLVWNPWNQIWETQSIWRTEKFTNRRFFIMGFTGFRFISKKLDVRSFSVGLAYFDQTLEDIPIKYRTGWEVDSPLERLFVPTISYTYKFGKLF
jgi:hypothetical protein